MGIVFIILEPLSPLASFLNITPWSFSLENAYTSPQRGDNLLQLGIINIISTVVFDVAMA